MNIWERQKVAKSIFSQQRDDSDENEADSDEEMQHQYQMTSTNTGARNNKVWVAPW